jgi:hypothetical protein
MADAAATLTQDRQKAGTVGAFGAGGDLHRRDDRVPRRLHDLARLPELFVDRQAVLCGLANYSKLASDYEFWHGLWVTIALYLLSLVLQLVFGVWLALVLFHAKRLPGNRAVDVHLALHDAAGGRRHDVARDPRSVARGGKLHPAIARPAAIGVAGLAEVGHSDQSR